MSRKRKDKSEQITKSKSVLDNTQRHVKLVKMTKERVIRKSRVVARKNQLAVIRQKPRQQLDNKLGKIVFACAFLLKIFALSLLEPNQLLRMVEALRITNFRVPSFVPANLPTMPSYGHQPNQQVADLAKPILFDCDYEYNPGEDVKLAVKWFKNKESEPISQWLPELNVRHYADWIKPLVNQTFVSDPLDPMKRFRSLLISRLSMNLTGQYTCLVSSLAGQDMRQATLVVYQPPRNFTFEHRIYPAPASFLPALPQSHHHHQANPMLKPQQPNLQQTTLRGLPYQPSPTVFGESEAAPPLFASRPGTSPTQFKGGQRPQANPPMDSTGLWDMDAAGARHYPTANYQQPPAARAGANIVRPPNNNSQNQSLPQTPITTTSTTSSPTKIVYTHDGRPIKRPLRRRRRQLDTKMELEMQQQQRAATATQISSWQLRKKLGEPAAGSAAPQPPAYLQPPNQNYALQLHHFQCQATQVTPRPVLVIMVKRDADSIAQYLHESTLVSIRPYQVSQAELFSAAVSPNYTYSMLPSYAQQLESGGGSSTEPPLMVTLYDITVSATVALNVSLPSYSATTNPSVGPVRHSSLPGAGELDYYQRHQQQPIGINTILAYRRGQRMSFECHLELTGTEFERRKRILINEEEVFQFAEAEERTRLLRLHQMHESQRRQQLDHSRGQQSDFDSSSAAASVDSRRQYGLALALTLATQLVILVLSNLAHGHERMLSRRQTISRPAREQITPEEAVTLLARCQTSRWNSDVVFTVRDGREPHKQLICNQNSFQ